jgi:hypothetical protein
LHRREFIDRTYRSRSHTVETLLALDGDIRAAGSFELDFEVAYTTVSFAALSFVSCARLTLADVVEVLVDELQDPSAHTPSSKRAMLANAKY